VLVEAVDYHTAGEPFRIVTGGVPPLEGATVLEKRRFARERLDDVRRLLVYEPRGHADMYGCHVVEPNDDGADLGVVFFHNEGYSTACGHGTIALVTWAIDEGRLAGPRVVVDVPSGRLETTARIEDGRVRSVRFRNVPCYVHARGLDVGGMRVDVGFGGAFYAHVDARAVGLPVEPAALPELIRLGRELKRAIEAEHDVVHPLQPELRGIYGVMFSEPDPGGGERNVTVFADGEVDRSPCGSSTSARIAVLGLAPGEELRSVSIVGTEFAARCVARAEVAGRPAVVPEVEGSAYRTGTHSFTLDPDDPVGLGFLLR
jgi:proline racemase/trans-L-3-hydroxyproline dehydratase